MHFVMRSCSSQQLGQAIRQRDKVDARNGVNVQPSPEPPPSCRLFRFHHTASPPDYRKQIWASLLPPPNQRPRLRLQPVRHGRINARSRPQPQGVSWEKKEKRKTLALAWLQRLVVGIDWGVGLAAVERGPAHHHQLSRVCLSVCLSVGLSNLPTKLRAIVCRLWLCLAAACSVRAVQLCSVLCFLCSFVLVRACVSLCEVSRSPDHTIS